jgi:hypothetical protein
MTTQTNAGVEARTEAAQLPDSFTRDDIEQRSRAEGEPAWMRELRLDAFDAYARLPMPEARARAWKYYDPQRLRLNGLRLREDPT